MAKLIGEGGRKKAVAMALRPHASPEVALAALDHALSGTGKKRIGVDEVDVILDELGTWAEDDFMPFLASRRGWKSERMTTLEWALRQIEEARAETKAAARAEEKLDRIEEVIRAALEER